MLRYLTAGESHGPALVGIIEGLPAGIAVIEEQLNNELKRRQSGYGRGGRMKIEKDKARVLSGIRFGKTIGSPISVLIENKDWENWSDIMAQFPAAKTAPLTKPRPGHADLAGMIKFGQPDVRNVLERASARETSVRVACGYFAKAFLLELGIQTLSHVTEVGSVKAEALVIALESIAAIEESEVRCLDKTASRMMMSEIDNAVLNKETLGGVFEVLVFGLPAGIGSYTHWDRKLDARIAMAVKSVQAIKAVEFGDGFKLAREKGSKVHDEIFYSEAKGYFRKTNRGGGFEGGMSNGETLVVRAAMKPIATIPQPLSTVDVITKETAQAIVERSDTCAVPAAAVIAEACVAIEVARAVLEQFGSGSITAICERFNSYKESVHSLDI